MKNFLKAVGLLAIMLGTVGMLVGSCGDGSFDVTHFGPDPGGDVVE